MRLSNEFRNLLKDCEEIWFAVAMVSKSGFSFVQEHINENAKQNFLVGVGLPTSPEVLSEMLLRDGNGLFQSKIYHKENTLFHPKVYIMRANGRLLAFVGSGNWTDGGLHNNDELSIKIDDQQFCEKILHNWFFPKFKHGIAITEDFLCSYRILFEKRSLRQRQEQQDLKLLFPDNALDLDAIDFSGQFFKKDHFFAFSGRKPFEHTEEADRGRINVRNHLFKLHALLIREIESKGWNLHPHYVFNDIVSSAQHGAYTAAELQAIWLHYGRNKSEIKSYGEHETPLDYMRLQVIVHRDNVGIWNRIGKDNGSKIDREHLKVKLRKDADYREEFFTAVKSLPKGYYIRLNDESRESSSFKDANDLTSFILKADIRYYFIIGIDLSPDDSRLSSNNIVKTILDNFEYLLPTYNMIKHRLEL